MNHPILNLQSSISDFRFPISDFRFPISDFRINYSALKVLVILIILYGTIPSYMAQAQTDSLNNFISVDSGIVNMDTTLRTEHDVIVVSENGEKTFFAGGDQSTYEGRVGIGTQSPSKKLSIYDDQNASFRMSQGVNTGIKNYDIGFYENPTGTGLMNSAVLQSTSSSTTPAAQGALFTVPGFLNNATQYPGFNLDAPCDNPSMVYSAYDYIWQNTDCSSPNSNALMFLSNSGDLALFGSHYIDENLVVNNTLLANSSTQTTTATGSFIVKDLAGVELVKVNSTTGKMYAKYIKVQTTNFPDYVFDKHYKLMPLYELEQYISQHHHLPELPSAAEAETNGVDVSEMQNTLLKKIEELTLYIVQQQKQIDALQLTQNNNTTATTPAVVPSVLEKK
jgi:hypothetical protein